jgi:hypothetical protein
MHQLETRGPTMGSADTLVGSLRTAFAPGDCQVGPKVCMGVYVVFLARLCRDVGP